MLPCHHGTTEPHMPCNYSSDAMESQPRCCAQNASSVFQMTAPWPLIFEFAPAGEPPRYISIVHRLPHLDCICDSFLLVTKPCLFSSSHVMLHPGTAAVMCSRMTGSAPQLRPAYLPSIIYQRACVPTLVIGFPASGRSEMTSLQTQ